MIVWASALDDSYSDLPRRPVYLPLVHQLVKYLAQFEPSRYNDPSLRRAAAEQVEVRLDPALKGVEAKVEIETADGSRLSAHCIHPRGSFENPLSRGEVEDKLRAYAKGLLVDAAVEEVIGMIATLEDLPSVCPLMELLRAPPRRVRAA